MHPKPGRVACCTGASLTVGANPGITNSGTLMNDSLGQVPRIPKGAFACLTMGFVAGSLRRLGFSLGVLPYCWLLGRRTRAWPDDVRHRYLVHGYSPELERRASLEGASRGRTAKYSRTGLPRRRTSPLTCDVTPSRPRSHSPPQDPTSSPPLRSPPRLGLASPPPT